MPVDYQNGQVYKVWSPLGSLINIGSTCQKLSMRMASHRSDCKKGLTCFTVKKCGDYTGGELCFPEYQMGCNVEQGDLLIFNPHIIHCNNKLEGEGRMSMVFYLREKMNQCDSTI